VYGLSILKPSEDDDLDCVRDVRRGDGGKGEGNNLDA
jgi:hypothetical protein